MSKENITQNLVSKKVWQKPEIYVLDTNGINSGSRAGFHEKSITNSIPTGGGSYIFLFSSGGNTLVAHPKHSYHS